MYNETTVPVPYKMADMLADKGFFPVAEEFFISVQCKCNTTSPFVRFLTEWVPIEKDLTFEMILSVDLMMLNNTDNTICLCGVACQYDEVKCVTADYLFIGNIESAVMFDAFALKRNESFHECESHDVFGHKRYMATEKTNHGERRQSLCTTVDPVSLIKINRDNPTWSLKAVLTNLVNHK